MASRGLRNNNPLNIRTGDNWQGLADEQTDPSFCVFSSPEYGLRAAAKLLLNYQSRYGCWSIQAIVNRWAPESENDTAAYVASVAKGCGVNKDELYDLSHMENMAKILRAMTIHENGSCPYDNVMLENGASMAGVR